MAEVRDWTRNRDMWVTLLETRTGETLAAWNARVRREGPATRAELQAWLEARGVTGYGKTILVMERFGYPDWMTADASDLLDAQYEKRPELRKIYDKVLKAVTKFGDVAVQVRKTYVSLVTSRRTFARVQAGEDHVKVALRLEGRRPGGRLQKSRVHDEMPVELAFEKPSDVDSQTLALIREAYEASL